MSRIACAGARPVEKSRRSPSGAERLTMSRRFAAALVVTVFSAAPISIGSAYAQSAAPPSITDAVTTAATAQFADQSIAAMPRVNPRTDVTWTTPVLGSLQAGLVATQMLDVHSTFRALDAGAVEGNPMVSGLVKNRAA